MRMSNLLFVAAAFTVTWIVLIGYLLHLRRTASRARAAFEQATRASAS